MWLNLYFFKFPAQISKYSLHFVHKDYGSIAIGSIHRQYYVVVCGSICLIFLQIGSPSNSKTLFKISKILLGNSIQQRSMFFTTLLTIVKNQFELDVYKFGQIYL